MAHIGPEVRRRRETFGWSQAKLAKLSGLSEGFLSRLEQQKTGYSVETEEKIAQTLNTTVQDLHGDGFSNVQEMPPDHRRIPLLDYARAGEFAGEAPVFTDEEMKNAVMTGLDHSPYTFALPIEGKAMEPQFSVGDNIVIDPTVRPEPGDFVLAGRVGQRGSTFRKWRDLGINDSGLPAFELVPLNPDYPSLRSDSGPECLKVIGTMVEHRIYRRRP